MVGKRLCISWDTWGFNRSWIPSWHRGEVSGDLYVWIYGWQFHFVKASQSDAGAKS